MTEDDVLEEGKHLNFDDAISDEDLADYLEVVFDALDVHLDRERIRHGLWKQYTARDQCNPIKFKIDRVLNSMDIFDSGIVEAALQENAVSELHDIINYAIFAIRKLQGTA